MSKPVLPQNDNVAHALAGAGGGLLSMALTYPLITLSTRAQVESKRAESRFIDAVQNIIAREGVSGLYSGLNSGPLRHQRHQLCLLLLKATASRPGRVAGKLTTVESMLAGALAGSATVIITNPIWVVNTRVTTRGRAQEEKVKEGDEEAQVEKKKKAKAPSTLGVLLALLKYEGPQALFAGVIPALVLVINPILQYTLFEQMKNSVEKKRRVTPTIAFFLGALGKLFATSVTYPYITVKSQMHVAAHGEKKEGVFQAINRVVKEEGYKGLYKGIGPKVTQSVLTAALLFAFKDVLYEQTVKLRLAAAKKRA
ncbi:peroxisomal membrane protein PMP47B [Verticillium dahliae VdLs.17]|uniref:Peroxisomal membrane protein PMP47B n=1 Tax=Verticillium dahliae (strain VdLs.17 / ATCC MYA-4575 / FGSC 10137) TaxID=498257 RepID=G2XAC7_VERDV|nr:peroxisomal membrane protein PMP47B [Verticillium dahliae VdLs.17]EGY15866.1 peroxisomal membrane protein PMP47B [Verticillium dahliae VdLs.17]